MRKILSLLLIISIFALGATGCKGSPADTTTSPTVNATGSATKQDENAAASGQPKTAEPGESEPPEQGYVPIEIRIAGLKGATSMGLVHLMESADAGVSANDYEFTMAIAADEITPLLIRGELDIAAIPANLASVLYNNTDGEVKLLAVNTLGVITLLKRRWDKLASGPERENCLCDRQGTVPEYVLRYLLAENGVDRITI